MSYQRNAQKLEAASERFIGLIAQITHNVQAGRNSIDSAAKVAVLASQAALASVEFWEALTVAHCDTFGLDPDAEEWNGFRTVRPNIPNETPEDFAEWARSVAKDRSYGSSVDLRPVLAQAAE